MKSVLSEFLTLLNRKEGAQFSTKLWYFLNEIQSKIQKVVVKALFFYKLKDSERTLREIAENHGWEEVFCNLCGSRKFEVIGRKKGFKIVKCLNCGLCFVTPRFSPGGRKCFYSSKYHFLGYPLFYAFNKLDVAVNERFSCDQILATIRLYKKTGNLIEIGPFGKEFTNIGRYKGFRCWRLKSDGWAYDFAVEEREYRTRDGCFSINGKRFDVVSCIDILDRIPDPLGELNGVYRILEDDGILLVRIPSYSTIIGEEKGTAWHCNRAWEKIYQFDYFHLKDLLDKSGFKIVDLKTELSDGVGSPGCIIIVGMKKNWRINKNNPRILVIREGAAGDVLLTTPIIRELKRRFPDSHLVFKTKYPEILQNNPYVDEVTRFEPEGDIDAVFNMMSELYPNTSIIEAYEKITQLSVECPKIEFYLSNLEKKWIIRYMKKLHIEDDKGFVAIHPMSGDRIKRWNADRYQAVSDYILSRKLKVVTVGSPIDCVKLKGAVNLIGKLSLRQSAALISKAKLFVGLDSFPMHVANAFGIPCVILFGSTAPSEILADARNVKIVQSSEYCLGCRRHTAPDRWSQNVDCRRERLYCMENISVDRVIGQIQETLKEIF